MIKILEYSLKSPEVNELCRKFNETTSELSGFSPRSPLLWSEIYDEKSHLLLAKDGTRNIGYLVVSLHLYSGARIATVSELCVWERKQETANALLDQAQTLAKQMNATALVSWEHPEEKINEALKQSGYFSIGRSIFSIGVTSLDFIKKTLESKNKSTSSKHIGDSKNITVYLSRKKLLAYSGAFTVKIDSDGTVTVDEGESNEKPYACVTTNVVTFSEIILALRNPLTAIFTGELRIEPRIKTLQVVKILRHVSHRVEWYLPLGDYF